jgi:hypothetical protein
MCASGLPGEMIVSEFATQRYSKGEKSMENKLALASVAVTLTDA